MAAEVEVRVPSKWLAGPSGQVVDVVGGVANARGDPDGEVVGF